MKKLSARKGAIITPVGEPKRKDMIEYYNNLLKEKGITKPYITLVLEDILSKLNCLIEKMDANKSNRYSDDVREIK